MNASYFFTTFSGEHITNMQIVLQCSIAIFLLFTFFMTTDYLGEKHSALVYTLFLLFSITLYTGSVIAYFSPEERNMQIPDDEYEYKRIFHYVFTYMRNYMDYREESIFFGFIIGLIAIPQVIAYMISGIFGCASRPRFISLITEFCILSVSKTMISFAGFVVGTNTTLLLLQNVDEDTPIPANVWYTPITPLSFSLLIALLIVYPFAILSGYYLLKDIKIDRLPRFVVKAHEFMRRRRSGVI